MIIKNGEVFQEDGSFQIQDLYVENHKIVATEAEVTDKTVGASGTGGCTQPRCIWPRLFRCRPGGA